MPFGLLNFDTIHLLFIRLDVALGLLNFTVFHHKLLDPVEGNCPFLDHVAVYPLIEALDAFLLAL